MLEVEEAMRWETHTALALKSFLCGWDRNEANSHSKQQKKGVKLLFSLEEHARYSGNHANRYKRVSYNSI